MSDFSIDESIVNATDTDVLDDQIMEATQRIAQERERLLALALVKGYDGVDIHTKDMVHTDPTDYTIGFEYEAWEGEPPTLERFGSGVQRYDFTALTDSEKRMVLGLVGANLEDIE